MKLRGVSDASRTYTSVTQKVDIGGLKVDIWLFVDTSEQDRLTKATLDQKYKNIYLSSVSHSFRSPLNSK